MSKHPSIPPMPPGPVPDAVKCMMQIMATTPAHQPSGESLSSASAAAAAAAKKGSKAVEWRLERTPHQRPMDVREEMQRFSDLRELAAKRRDQHPAATDIDIQCMIVTQGGGRADDETAEFWTQYCYDRRNMFKLATSRNTTVKALRDVRVGWRIKRWIEMGMVTEDHARLIYRFYRTPRAMLEEMERSGYYKSLSSGGRAGALHAQYEKDDAVVAGYDTVEEYRAAMRKVMETPMSDDLVVPDGYEDLRAAIDMVRGLCEASSS